MDIPTFGRAIRMLEFKLFSLNVQSDAFKDKSFLVGISLLLLFNLFSFTISVLILPVWLSLFLVCENYCISVYLLFFLFFLFAFFFLCLLILPFASRSFYITSVFHYFRQKPRWHFAHQHLLIFCYFLSRHAIHSLPVFLSYLSHVIPLHLFHQQLFKKIFLFHFIHPHFRIL